MAAGRVTKKKTKSATNVPAGPPRRSARQAAIAAKVAKIEASSEVADLLNKSISQQSHVAPIPDPTPYVDSSAEDVDYDEDTPTPGSGPHSARPLPALAPPKKLPSKDAVKKVEGSRVSKTSPKKIPNASKSKKSVPKRKRYSEKVFWTIDEEAALARAYVKHIPYARIVRDILPGRTSGSCKTKVRDMKVDFIIIVWKKGYSAGTLQYDPGMHAFQRGLPHQNVTKDSFKGVWDGMGFDDEGKKKEKGKKKPDGKKKAGGRKKQQVDEVIEDDEDEVVAFGDDDDI